MTMPDIMNSSNMSILDLQLKFKELGESMDDFFLIICAVFISLMQIGFGYLEAGSIRAKNATNVMMKNMLDSFICGLSYWLVGYTLAFGSGSPFLGLGPYIAGTGLAANKQFAHWLFQISYASTPATIVSGAVAERCGFIGYLIYSFVISGIVYPVVCHWVWTPEGWLTILGFKDFCGSGVVHMLGGCCAIMATVVLGPRIGRFTKTDAESDPDEFEAHNTPNAGLGAMILFTGFLAFNGSSVLHISQPGDGQLVGKIIINTILAGSGGCLGVLVLVRCGVLDGGWEYGRWSFLHPVNGGLAGMVSICAHADTMEIWAALLMGLFVSLVYCGISLIVPRLKVDDPIGVIPVHFGGGLWGLLGGSLLRSDSLAGGYGRAAGIYLGYSIIGALSIMAWAWIVCGVLFVSLRYAGLLRSSAEEEIRGMDISKHREPAYRIMFLAPYEENTTVPQHKISQITTRTSISSISDGMSMRMSPSSYAATA